MIYIIGKIDCTGPDCKWVTGARGYQYDPLDCTAYYTCLRLGDTLQILYEHCPRGGSLNSFNIIQNKISIN